MVYDVTNERPLFDDMGDEIPTNSMRTCVVYRCLPLAVGLSLAKAAVLNRGHVAWGAMG